jgi:hypothetical protein
MGEGCVGQVDEDTLSVAQRCNPHQSPDGFDVAPGFAYEATDIPIGELDFDGDRTATPLENLYMNLVGLIG